VVQGEKRLRGHHIGLIVKWYSQSLMRLGRKCKVCGRGRVFMIMDIGLTVSNANDSPASSATHFAWCSVRAVVVVVAVAVPTVQCASLSTASTYGLGFRILNSCLIFQV
jgi:hypothetical protein